MSLLADLFNPSFLIFLGILVLVAALLVVYMESKNREQNHKISSMFSLVSSLAEEVNGLKYVLASTSLYNNDFVQENTQYNSTKEIPMEIPLLNNNLIAVSDDEDESDSENDSDSDSDNDSNIDSDNDLDNDLESVESRDSIDELDEDELQHNDVKVLKLTIGGQPNNHDSLLMIDELHNILENDLDDHLDVDDLENDLDDDLDNELDDHLDVDDDEEDQLTDTNKSSDQHTNFEGLDHEGLKNEEKLSEIFSSDLKTININLEDSNTANIDYKKFSLPKLRSVVTEKGLSIDTSKLKKNELLKLLEVE
jgi:hypothetical protein